MVGGRSDTLLSAARAWLSTASVSGQDQEDSYPAHRPVRRPCSACKVPVGVWASGRRPGSLLQTCRAGMKLWTSGPATSPQYTAPALAGQMLVTVTLAGQDALLPAALGCMSCRLHPTPCLPGQLALSLDHLESTRYLHLGPSPVTGGPAACCPLLTGPATGWGRLPRSQGPPWATPQAPSLPGHFLLALGTDGPEA